LTRQALYYEVTSPLSSLLFVLLGIFHRSPSFLLGLLVNL
jgi:hypothetical protein